MTNNNFAVTNIETMAHNVAIYASYFDRCEDFFGEIDAALYEAERCLNKFACIMRNNSSTL